MKKMPVVYGAMDSWLKNTLEILYLLHGVVPVVSLVVSVMLFSDNNRLTALK
jgi:hypothetical protein